MGTAEIIWGGMAAISHYLGAFGFLRRLGRVGELGLRCSYLALEIIHEGGF